LLPRSSSASDWEKFEIVEIQNGEYALKARANNKYVKADLDNGGKLVASSDSVAGAWEAFKITKTGESSGLTYSGSEKKQNFILILITTELRFHFQPENMIIMQWYQQESKTMHFHQLKFLTDIELHYIMMQDSKEEQKFFFRIHQI
ncbi:hypothetical protein LEA_06970, partial [human gut metagenome]